MQGTKSSLELVWKIIFNSILEIFYSIPFCNLPHSIPKHPFHSIPCPGCRFYITIIIATFYRNGCSLFRSLKIRKRLILKKLLPLPASFQHFCFRVRFRFQSLSSKCFRFHKKLTASTTSASTFLFYIPGLRLGFPISRDFCGTGKTGKI